MEKKQPLVVRTAVQADHPYASVIAAEMAASAKARGTGIAQRSPDYLKQKMAEGKAIIAHTSSGDWAGFCYIEAWQHDKFVANSGLIVSPEFRGSGVARAIKRKIFELSRKKYPEAKIFGLTTGLSVMKINSELGYVPVTYSELTEDANFWAGCKSCVNYDILRAKNKRNCICTAMLYDPADKVKVERAENTGVSSKSFKGNLKLFERWIRFKKHVLLKKAATRKQRKTTTCVVI